MKRPLIIVITVVLLAGIVEAAYRYLSNRQNPESNRMSNNTPNESVEAQPKTPKNTLVVYLTRTGNTEAVAKMIHDEVGGKLVEVETEAPYPEDYQAQVDQVSDENSRNYLPSLKTNIDDIASYDTIFIGSPTWGMQLPPPTKSFLAKYDLSGKTVIPFNTNGGYGVGSSFDDIKERCKGCDVLEGFSVQGGRERDGILFVMEGDKETEVKTQVHTWLERINVI